MIRDIQEVDDDIVRAKRKIKQRLINDPDVIEALDNPSLNPEEPDAYMYVNIFDYIKIPGATTEKLNFITFDIKQENILTSNDYMKQNTYLFTVIVYEDKVVTKYGMSRVDLLSYLIRDLFNYSNCVGTRLILYQNSPAITDGYWISRTLSFKEITPNSPYKGRLVNAYDERMKVKADA